MKYFFVSITLLGLLVTAPAISQVNNIHPVVVDRAYVHFLEHASMAFDRAGTITSLHFKQGDIVSADEPLVQLDDTVASRAHSIAVAKAESTVAIEFATVLHEGARTEFEAMLRANEKAEGTYSLTDVERLRIETEKAKLQIEQAEEEHQQAILTREHSFAELSTFQIRAPFNGRISKIHVSKGDSVQQGEKILELVDETKLRVQGYVPYSQAWSIAAGDKITVRVIDPEIARVLKQTEFEGKLEYVNVAVETVRRVVAISGIVENTEGELKDGLEVELTIYPTPNRK